jgi:hypothetical protein
LLLAAAIAPALAHSPRPPSRPALVAGVSIRDLDEIFHADGALCSRLVTLMCQFAMLLASAASDTLVDRCPPPLEPGQGSPPPTKQKRQRISMKDPSIGVTPVRAESPPPDTRTHAYHASHPHPPRAAFPVAFPVGHPGAADGPPADANERDDD